MFENDDTVVFGISCDTTATLKVFAEQESYEFALLSDFWPHGAVSQAYGVFFDKGGFPLRGTFIIDKAGVVRWSVVNSPGRRPSYVGLPRGPRRAVARAAAGLRPATRHNRAMGCLRCGRRQVDPDSGPSAWRRAVVAGEQVLVCPDCQVEGWTDGLDRCARVRVDGRS